MNLADFYYDLPENLIGQKAIEPRDSCRLMVIKRQKGTIEHHRFSDLVDILDKNSILILNDTKVFPARLFGKKETGGKTEVLLLKQLSSNSFSALGKGKLAVGSKIFFSDNFFGLTNSNTDGEIVLQFNRSGVNLLETIDQLGKTPLPPYIHTNEAENDLRQQYQTVYAKEKGSAAAPTAGLHFTDSLLLDLQAKGVQIEKVTLHVGLGTFKPVTETQIATKTLHTESFYLSEEVAERLNTAKKQGKKIIAVGTTSCRLLETVTDDKGVVHSGHGETSIFIQPGYRFKLVDGLITNFHLPSTSLLMLVSALSLFPNTIQEFTVFKKTLIGKAYQEAITKKYKFFSFGDAMMII